MPINRKRRSGRYRPEELEQRIVDAVRELRVAHLRDIQNRLWPDLSPNAVSKYLCRMTRPGGKLVKARHNEYTLRTAASLDSDLARTSQVPDEDYASVEDLAKGRYGRRL